MFYDATLGAIFFHRVLLVNTLLGGVLALPFAIYLIKKAEPFGLPLSFEHRRQARP